MSIDIFCSNECTFKNPDIFFLIAGNVDVERSGLTKSFKGMEILQASLLKSKTAARKSINLNGNCQSVVCHCSCFYM